MARRATSDHELPALEKAPTGIKGLDQISGGGLPRGRTTIVCGGPGCGKIMLGLEFLVRGAIQFNEPGVLVAFEEMPQEMARNVASLGFDLQDLADQKNFFSITCMSRPARFRKRANTISRAFLFACRTPLIPWAQNE